MAHGLCLHTASQVHPTLVPYSLSLSVNKTKPKPSWQSSLFARHRGHRLEGFWWPCLWGSLWSWPQLADPGRTAEPTTPGRGLEPAPTSAFSFWVRATTLPPTRWRTAGGSGTSTGHHQPLPVPKRTSCGCGAAAPRGRPGLRVPQPHSSSKSSGLGSALDTRHQGRGPGGQDGAESGRFFLGCANVTPALLS